MLHASVTVLSAEATAKALSTHILCMYPRYLSDNWALIPTAKALKDMSPSSSPVLLPSPSRIASRAGSCMCIQCPLATPIVAPGAGRGRAAVYGGLPAVQLVLSSDGRTCCARLCAALLCEALCHMPQPKLHCGCRQSLWGSGQCYKVLWSMLDHSVEDSCAGEQARCCVAHRSGASARALASCIFWKAHATHAVSLCIHRWYSTLSNTYTHTENQKR